MGGGVQLPQRTFNCNGAEALNLPDRKIAAFRVKTTCILLYILSPCKSHYCITRK